MQPHELALRVLCMIMALSHKHFLVNNTESERFYTDDHNGNGKSLFEITYFEEIVRNQEGR